MAHKTTRSNLCLYTFIIALSLFTTNNHNLSTPNARATTNTLELPTTSLNQTADMKLAFLGVPTENINQTQLTQLLPSTVEQFAHPNTITWTLNFTLTFQPFPDNISETLNQNAFRTGTTVYLNITLLDTLLSQVHDVTIPKRGYLLTFISIPNATGHSWFYVRERPDLFLNRTDYFNGAPIEYWAFPPNFGGARRALYFDLSQTMQQSPTENSLTNTVATLISNSLADVFPSLGGSIDPRWIAADTQEYRHYRVQILWLNGTEAQSPINQDQIRASLEDLMPWTSWTVTTQTEPADKALDELIQGRTSDLTTPINYSILLSNGTQLTIPSTRNVDWNPYENSGENDPVNQYFFSHAEDYFNLTDPQDKSVIPVVLMQLDNDTAFGGSFQGGVSWFPHNVIIIAFQGNLITALGEIGQTGLTQLVRHEIGHWVSLIDHSSDFASGYPKIICSMRSMTDKFCAFCKDARARISFISYYDSTTQLLAKNQTKGTALLDQLNSALQSFYDWNYTEALNKIVPMHYGLDTTPPTISNVTQTPSQDSVLPKDAVAVNATVTDDLSGVRRVTLNYTNNDGTWSTVEMTNTEGNIWNAKIPAFPYDTNVTYAVTAEDNFNNIATTQTGQEYRYRVIPEFPSPTILSILLATLALTCTACRKKLRKQDRAVTRKQRASATNALDTKKQPSLPKTDKPCWQTTVRTASIENEAQEAQTWKN